MSIFWSKWAIKHLYTTHHCWYINIFSYLAIFSLFCVQKLAILGLIFNSDHFTISKRSRNGDILAKMMVDHLHTTHHCRDMDIFWYLAIFSHFLQKLAILGILFDTDHFNISKHNRKWIFWSKWGVNYLHTTHHCWYIDIFWYLAIFSHFFKQ